MVCQGSDFLWTVERGIFILGISHWKFGFTWILFPVSLGGTTGCEPQVMIGVRMHREMEKDSYKQDTNFSLKFKSESESEVSQSCLTLCDPVGCSPPGSSSHGIFQARVPEWGATAFSRGYSRPRDQTPGLPHCRQTLYHLSHQGNESLGKIQV